MEELFGFANGPEVSKMNTLVYKYKMAEPFMNGDQSMYQISHDQVEFKGKREPGIQFDLKQLSEIKTKQEEFEEIKTQHH